MRKYISDILRITSTPPFTLLFHFCFGKTLSCWWKLQTTKTSQTHKTKQPTPHLLPTEVEQEEDKTMDVTFVLEESGVTATVEVPCEADVAAAKEVACTALAVSPASVEMRIGTQVLEGTCRLQDTAFDSGVQVVLARCFADIKCPAEYSVEAPTGTQWMNMNRLSLSPCGALCLFTQEDGYVTGFDTDTFSPAFRFKVDIVDISAPAISRCKTRCYVACKEEGMHEVALPGGEVLRKVEGPSFKAFVCGGVVVSQGKHGVSVYDEDLTLLRSLSHEGCNGVAVSHCGGWVITSSFSHQKARLWDVDTGEGVACVPADGGIVSLSRSACVFAVECDDEVHLYDWSGAALGSFEKQQYVLAVQFTPCGKYVVVAFDNSGDLFSEEYTLHQYDVVTMSCVRVIQDCGSIFVISPCSRVVVFKAAGGDVVVTQHLHPY